MKKQILYFSLIVSALAMTFTGCKAPTDIAYFQDMHEQQMAAIVEAKDIKVKPYDKLTILVKSKDTEFSDILNLSMGGSGAQNPQSAFAYTVDAEGNIDMPMLGKVHIEGMTRPEVAAYVKGLLVSQHIVLDPTVIVDYQNLYYSVLGEVRNPGVFNIEKDRVTILEAIAKAGDLQITGERTNVSVVRREGNDQKHYYVDITDAKSLYQSPVFYLQQDDVVYVEPNAKRMRESRPNGNTFNTASFWIGIVSMAASLTSIVVTLAK